ncbi:hypothetical protein VTL71DRAFT_14043 [Oculimacula yallundae]|uniref:FAD-binding PCMH-type domain-containing protein n=1 Tax=Oculimacula yallundae TaxID=86028 RepID=A0ABR4CM29_9HELO
MQKVSIIEDGTDNPGDKISGHSVSQAVSLSLLIPDHQFNLDIKREAVAALYPDQVLTAKSSAYANAQGTFWNTRQKDTAPGCFFQPKTTEQVQAAIVEVVRAKCPFAIKGGGHSSNPKGSSIQDGFQFDLSHIDHIRIAEDKETVEVGPGVHWGQLYLELEKHGIIAVGGRDAIVGVPGFIFGGGISYYANQYGWGIDNLISVDIVLANGELITASAESHLDLFKALRGGAHNFGIVTNLVLKVHPYDGMWGGYNIAQEEHFDAVFEAYDQYSKDLVSDGKAHMILDFYRRDGVLMVVEFMGYPDPKPDPPIYDKIRQIPSLDNTLRVAHYSDLAQEMTVATDCSNKRNMYWTLAMEYDIKLLRSALEIWIEGTALSTEKFSTAFDVNHITPAMRNKSSRNGLGNLYGLEGANVPLTNILLTGTWENASDDAEINELLKGITHRIEALAKKEGKDCAFKYMNYANAEQDVISSFGQDAKTFMLDVAAKYDPEGIFQKLQPGAWKLDLKK